MTPWNDCQFPLELRRIFADWIESQNWELSQDNPNHANLLLATFLQMIREYRPSGNLLEQTRFQQARDDFRATYENNSQLFVTNVRNMLIQEIQLLRESQQNPGYFAALRGHYEKNKKLYTAAGIVGGVTIGTLAAIPLGIYGLGFTVGGVASGSAAAAAQSYVYGGATTGLFSALQSAGVLGASATAKAGIVGAANAIALRHFYNRNPPPNDPPPSEQNDEK